MPQDNKEKIEASFKLATGMKEKDEGVEKETREIEKEAAEAAEVVQAPEITEKIEGAEFTEGKVAEEVREDKRRALGPAYTASLSTDEIEAIRAKLLANLPPEEIMVRQIKQKLHRDAKNLKKDFKRLKGMGHKAAYQLAKIVAQLRKIREYFALLANATFEVVKQLWLKIVHGV